MFTAICDNMLCFFAALSMMFLHNIIEMSGGELTERDIGNPDLAERLERTGETHYLEALNDLKDGGFVFELKDLKRENEEWLRALTEIPNSTEWRKETQNDPLAILCIPVVTNTAPRRWRRYLTQKMRYKT